MSTGQSDQPVSPTTASPTVIPDPNLIQKASKLMEMNKTKTEDPTDQCIVELSSDMLHTILDLKDGLSIIGLRVVKRGIDGKDVIQILLRGTGKVPMGGRRPLYPVPIAVAECGHAVFLWDALNMVAISDGILAPRREWPDEDVCTPSSVILVEGLIHDKQKGGFPPFVIPVQAKPINEMQTGDDTDAPLEGPELVDKPKET